MRIVYFCNLIGTKMNSRIAAIFIFLCLITGACHRIEPDPTEPSDDPTVPPGNQNQKPVWPEGEYGKEYVWDDETVPEFHISFTEKEWNNLLSGYDKNPDITSFFRCSVIFDKEGARDTVTKAGIRLFDNGDAMRPEGTSGSRHSRTDTRWQFSNYEIDFGRYSSDSSLRTVKSVYLKSCVNDPSYARERYCYNLFERFGIQSIGRNIYCRLNIHIEGDEKPAYIGLYQMIEPIDQSYLDDRKKLFESSGGFLWKCRNGASLMTSSSAMAFGIDNGNGEDYTYLLMTGKEAANTAAAQLEDFIRSIRSKNQNDFYDWIGKVCDVELLLRTYAVNVAVGMWDDYWNRGNNFYLYFNSTSKDTYKVYFIPFDYEMSLGNSRKDVMTDPGRQDPYNWGKQTNPLIIRLLQIPEYKEIFRNALMELVMPEAYLFELGISTAIVGDFMYQASFHSGTDTGINKGTKDRPAQWSSCQDYRISSADAGNFFEIRSETIRNYSE